MRTENILELTVDKLFEMFGKGRFASVVFEKKDGTLRKLTGKTHVNKHINGNGASYDAHERGQIRVFDVNADGWRTVTADRVKEVVANNTRYVVNV
jgi:hypothetical protein